MPGPAIVAIDFGTRRTAFSYTFSGNGHDGDSRDVTLGEKSVQLLFSFKAENSRNEYKFLVANVHKEAHWVVLLVTCKTDVSSAFSRSMCSFSRAIYRTLLKVEATIKPQDGAT